MAKRRVTGRVASFSTNRHWILRNENEYVWNGVHWIRPTSEEAAGAVGFRLRKMADSFRRDLMTKRPDGMIEVVRAPYQLQIRMRNRAVDEGFKCIGKEEKENEEND